MEIKFRTQSNILWDLVVIETGRCPRLSHFLSEAITIHYLLTLMGHPFSDDPLDFNWFQDI